MRIYHGYPNGRMRSHKVANADELWEELDWLVRRWGERMKNRPALQVAVTSTTGEQLMSFVRPAYCKRHRWMCSRDGETRLCHYCGARKKLTAKERTAHAKRSREIEAAGQRAVTKILGEMVG